MNDERVVRGHGPMLPSSRASAPLNRGELQTPVVSEPWSTFIRPVITVTASTPAVARPPGR